MQDGVVLDVHFFTMTHRNKSDCSESKIAWLWKINSPGLLILETALWKNLSNG